MECRSFVTTQKKNWTALTEKKKKEILIEKKREKAERSARC